MTKFYRRTGVTAFRFLIEAQIQKIDLKLPKPDIYSQRISVIFKRGELRKETHNAPLMEDGQAYFAEKLSVPAVLYYDKRKKLFLPKEATLAVNLISKRNTKLMGVTRFDLSTFVNNDIQEKDVVLKMEKCPDKNAKFHFRLVITQIKELGSTRPSMKMSIKESVRSGSIRSSFKDASLFSLRESFKDTTMPLKVFAEEQPKLSTGKKTHEDIDELYSYCTDSECSEKGEEKIPEVVEFEVASETIGDKDGLACMTDSFAADQLRASQNKPEFCNVSTLEKTFSHSTYSSPNKNEIKIIEDESEDLQPQPEVYTLNPSEPERPLLSQSPDMRNKRAQNLTRDLEQKVSTYEKEIVNLSNILLSGSQEFSSLKENHEQLKQDYEVLNKKYEALLSQKSLQSPTKQFSEDSDAHSRIMELENKLQQAESQNDLLTRMIQELEKTNQDYIVKLEKSIEKQAQPIYYNPQPNNIHQYKNMIDDVVHRLKEYKSVKLQDIQTCESIMQELVNKLNESQESLLQLKENSKLEKQKGQKEIEALEQGLQKLIREHETLKVKRQIKELQGETSYDNATHYHSQTMSFNSLKTREESLFDEHLNSAHDLSDHHGSGVKMHSGIFENAKAASKAENAALKQEINYLSAKLLAMVNIQSKFEEQIKQRQQLQIENKSLKSELDKAKKGWAYAEEERYELANKVKNTSQMTVGSEDTEKAEYLEFEVFKLKSKMAEMLNAVMEFGGADLSDKIEAIMTSQAGLNMEKENNFMSFA